MNIKLGYFNVIEMINKFEIFISIDNKVEVSVVLSEDTVWLNRQQLSVLFDRDVKTIGKHINNVFKEAELVADSVVAKFATTKSDGITYQITFYRKKQNIH
ncbi:MAG: hypothetical protein WEA99_10615 [Brumimicrobium sp.]